MAISTKWILLKTLSWCVSVAAVVVGLLAFFAVPTQPVHAGVCWGTVIGASSCYASCWHDNIPNCSPSYSFKCDARNFDVRAVLGIVTSYERTWSGVVDVCQDWPNSPCPGFCN